MRTEEKIIERLRKLPPQHLDKVLNFIDYILEQIQNQEAAADGDAGSRPIPESNRRYKGEELVKRLRELSRED